MKKNYIFSITGMTCHSCESLIRMDLEEAGFKDIVSLDHVTGRLEISLEESQVDAVKQVINTTKKYTVVSIVLKA